VIVEQMVDIVVGERDPDRVGNGKKAQKRKPDEGWEDIPESDPPLRGAACCGQGSSPTSKTKEVGRSPPPTRA
jgi:hypothetical protein